MSTATTETLGIERQHLLQALNQVTPNATRGSGLLAGVRLHAADGRLSLTTTDLELEVGTTVPADGDGFDVVVPARKLQQLAHTATGPLRIRPDSDAGDLIVEWGRSTAMLRTLPLDEWPRPPAIDGTEVKVPAPDVASLRKIANFASKDDARPILTAICVRGTEAAATDSYRLAIAKFTTELWDDETLLVPARVARHLPMLLDTEHATLLTDGRYCEISLGEIRVRSILVDGDFPPYDRLIPNTTAGVTFNRAELIAAVQTATVLCGATSPLRLDLSNVADGVGSAGVLGAEQDVGQVETLVAAATSSAALPPSTAAFNPRYFLELLTTCEGETVTLELVDALKPALVREHPYTLLIMPVRVS